MTDIPAKFCAGCGHPIVLNMLAFVLKEMQLTDRAVLGLDIGCSLLAWNFLPINTFQTHHGRVTPTMMGFKRAKKEAICLAYTGDGGAYSIGWQSLFNAARRDEPITVLVINNTVYAMTGGQSAPTTLVGQKTNTDLGGNKLPPFLGPELLRPIVNKDAFLARTAVTDPKQMSAYIKKAIECQQGGHFSLVEFLSFCPTNWRTKGKHTLDYLNNLKAVYQTGEIL